MQEELLGLVRALCYRLIERRAMIIKRLAFIIFVFLIKVENSEITPPTLP